VNGCLEYQPQSQRNDYHGYYHDLFQDGHFDGGEDGSKNGEKNGCENEAYFSGPRNWKTEVGEGDDGRERKTARCIQTVR
jgi:hypothetical protein